MQRLRGGTRFGIEALGCEGEPVRIEELFLAVGAVEGAVEVHEDDDGIFEPFGRMHGEHFDGVLSAALAEFHLVPGCPERKQEGVHGALRRLREAKHPP